MKIIQIKTDQGLEDLIVHDEDEKDIELNNEDTIDLSNVVREIDEKK